MTFCAVLTGHTAPCAAAQSAQGAQPNAWAAAPELPVDSSSWQLPSWHQMAPLRLHPVFSMRPHKGLLMPLAFAAGPHQGLNHLAAPLRARHPVRVRLPLDAQALRLRSENESCTWFGSPARVPVSTEAPFVTPSAARAEGPERHPSRCADCLPRAPPSGRPLLSFLKAFQTGTKQPARALYAAVPSQVNELSRGRSEVGSGEASGFTCLTSSASHTAAARVAPVQFVGVARSLYFRGAGGHNDNRGQVTSSASHTAARASPRSSPENRPALLFRLPSLFMMLMICRPRRCPTCDSGSNCRESRVDHLP